MPIYLGSTKIGPLYLGGTKIAEAYLGSTKIYSSTPAPYVPTLPYLIFEFSASGFAPTAGTTSRIGSWHQISSSPNRWYWEGFASSSFNPSDYGWPCAFCDTTGNYDGRLKPQYLGGGTCKVVGYGNLNYTSGGFSFTDMDRTFSGCDGLTEFVTIQTPNTMSNVGGCFQNCTELVDGALDQYTYWSTYNTGITNHSGTFADAGSNTVPGLADLNQIPVGWGGNLVPASNTCTALKLNAAAWKLDPTGTDVAIPFGNLTGDLYVFTTSSVSAYAGVNMRKTNIWNKMNSFSTSAATFYYPMFFQRAYPTSSSSQVTPVWIRCSSMYNGTLTAAQSAGDMPGTLDYSTYGPMDFEYGVYIPSDPVYFGFLVVNNPDLIVDGVFDPTMDAFGIHSNTNFRDSVLNWFVS